MSKNLFSTSPARLKMLSLGSAAFSEWASITLQLLSIS
jgi:hypothetical protein